MRKLRKAFTAIEAVITLGILGIGFALGGVLVSQIVAIQGKTTDEILVSNERYRFDDTVSGFVSFVSVENDVLSFAGADASESNSVSFVATASTKSLTYTLTYVNHRLSASLPDNYEEGVDLPYLNYSFSETFENLQSVTFNYSSSLKTLTANVLSGDGVAWNSVFLVRV